MSVPQYNKANVILSLKSGVEQKFMVEFSEPLTSDGMIEFCDLIRGQINGKKITDLQLPISTVTTVFIKFDEVAFSQVTFR